jgi:GntR family transcriptional regulator
VVNSILKPGEKLPTVRQLAVDLQVNFNTIMKAYSELELRGVINTQQGTGSFITEDRAVIDPKEKKKGLQSLCSTFLDEIAGLGITVEEAFSTLKTIVKERGKPNKGS